MFDICTQEGTHIFALISFLSFHQLQSTRQIRAQEEVFSSSAAFLLMLPAHLQDQNQEPFITGLFLDQCSQKKHKQYVKCRKGHQSLGFENSKIYRCFLLESFPYHVL